MFPRDAAATVTCDMPQLATPTPGLQRFVLGVGIAAHPTVSSVGVKQMPHVAKQLLMLDYLTLGYVVVIVIVVVKLVIIITRAAVQRLCDDFHHLELA
jgi:hypothetical protein